MENPSINKNIVISTPFIISFSFLPAFIVKSVMDIIVVLLFSHKQPFLGRLGHDADD